MKFFGEKPKQWHDELAFEYELRFASEPDDACCAALARAWIACGDVEKSALQPGPWTFSREFAYLVAIPRHSQHATLFAQVARFIKQVHASVAPLVEAVHLTAAEDYANLDAGPDLPHSQRPADATYPAPAPRSAFDEAVTAVYLAIRQARIAKLIVDPPAGHVGLAIATKTEPISNDDVPQSIRDLYTDDDGMRFDGSATHPRRVPVGAARIHSSIKAVIAGEARDVALPEGVTTRALSVPHPSAKSIAFAGNLGRSHVVLLLDAASGQVRVLWTAPDREDIQNVAWLTGDHLAVCTNLRILALDTSGEGEASITHARRGGDRPIRACLGGRLLHLVNEGFVAWNGAKLAPASKFKIDRMYFVNDADDQVVVRHGFDAEVAAADDTYFALTNVAEMLEQKAKPKAKRVAKKKTARKPRAASSKPTWEPAVATKLVEPDGEDNIARGGWTHPGNPSDHLLHWGPEKNPCAVRADGDDVVATLREEGYTLATGTDVHQVRAYRPKRLALSPGGTRGYGLDASLGIVHAFSRDSDEPEVVLIDHVAKTGDIGDIAAVAEDELVVLGKRAVVWMAKGDDGWKELARSTTIKNGQRVVAAGGHVAAIASGAKPLVVLALDEGKIKKVLSDADGATELFVHDGSIRAIRPSDDVVRLNVPG